MSKENEAKFVLRIDKEVYQELVDYAKQSDRSINKAIVYIIKEYLKSISK
jgi:hypothetical protein